MQRISFLLQKLKELAEQEHTSPIETDLMMDYTRVLYAELMEYKNKKIYTPTTVANIPDVPKETPQPSPQPAYDAPTTIEFIIEKPVQPKPATIEEDNDIEEEEEENDIRDFIGINDKYQIISELFGNQKDKYELMIDQLNTFDNELDALRWLQDNLYFEYSWSEDSEALIMLHNIMHHFYNNN